MATNIPPAPRKKTSPLVWILVGVLGFFFLIGILVVGAGFFVYHKAKQAGLDPELIRKNPAVAVVKMAVAANPDAELVSLDEDRGIVTVRDKKTGKTVTLNFEDVKRGRISFESEGEGKVSVEAKGEGESGAVEVKSADGTVKLGGGAEAKLPAWLPNYPGGTAEAAFNSSGQQGQAGTYNFTTTDSAAKVLDYYEAALKRAGLKVTTVRQDDGGMVLGEEEDGSRKAQVAVSPRNGKTGVGLSFQTK